MDEAVLSFKKIDRDIEGTYRYILNAAYYPDAESEGIRETIFTDELTIDYQMRTLKTVSFQADCDPETKLPSASVCLTAKDSDCIKTPTGSVIFRFSNSTFDQSYTVPLVKEGAREAVAEFKPDGEKYVLPEGVYQTEVYYNGNAVFAPYTTEPLFVLSGNSSIFAQTYKVDAQTQKETRIGTFCYGDTMDVKFFRYEKDENGVVRESGIDTMKAEGYPQQIKDEPKDYQVSVTIGDTEYPICYTVLKKPVVVSISVNDQMVAHIKDAEEPVIQCNPDIEALYGDKVSEIATLYYTDNTSKPKWASLRDIDTSNVNYVKTFYAKLSIPENSEKAKYYDITLNSSSFKVTNPSDNLILIADKYGEEEAGSIRMGSPYTRIIQGDHAVDPDHPDNQNTDLFVPYQNDGKTGVSLPLNESIGIELTAVPEPGFKFKRWLFNGQEDPTLSAKRSIFTNMGSKKLIGEAEFEPDYGSLILDERYSKDKGIIEKPEGYENSKQFRVDTALTFKAVDNEDYVFDYWLVSSEFGADKNTDNPLTMKVSEEPVTVYPMFRTAAITVTLGENIVGTYPPFPASQPF